MILHRILAPGVPCGCHAESGLKQQEGVQSEWPFLFAQVTNDIGVDDVIEHVLTAWGAAV